MTIPKDFLILSIGILMLIGPAVAIELSIPAPETTNSGGTTNNNPPESTPPHEETLVSKDGYTNEGQTTELKQNYTASKVLNLTATLTWTDDYGSNDVFSLEVQLDGKSIGQEQSNTGQLKVTAAANADEDLRGNYTVLITCVKAPGIIGPIPIDRDNGNSWSLKFSAEVQ